MLTEYDMATGEMLVCDQAEKLPEVQQIGAVTRNDCIPHLALQTVQETLTTPPDPYSVMLGGVPLEPFLRHMEG